MTKRQKQMRKAARKAPTWLREIAIGKVARKAISRDKAKRLGTFGPASPVRSVAP